MKKKESANKVNKLVEFIHGNPYKSIILLFIFGIIIQFVIQAIYWIGKFWVIIPTDFKAGEVLSFWGAFFSFIGTLALGALALWQNKQLNEINERLLEVEESKLRPMIDISLFDKEFVIFQKGIKKSTKEIILFDLDGKVCEITSNNNIVNHLGGMTWIFECENTSEIKIIYFDLHKLVLTYYYTDAKQEEFIPSTIGSSGDESLNPHECKPLIISGIESYSHEDKEHSILGTKLFLEFHCTNALGDIYKQELLLDLMFFPFEDVMYPGIAHKEFSKPQKLKTPY